MYIIQSILTRTAFDVRNQSKHRKEPQARDLESPFTTSIMAHNNKVDYASLYFLYAKRHLFTRNIRRLQGKTKFDVK